jgi:hypothetical protein
LCTKPDLSVPEKDEPTFVFTIYADVTDGAGKASYSRKPGAGAYPRPLRSGTRER